MPTLACFVKTNRNIQVQNEITARRTWVKKIYIYYIYIKTKAKGKEKKLIFSPQVDVSHFFLCLFLTSDATATRFLD